MDNRLEPTFHWLASATAGNCVVTVSQDCKHMGVYSKQGRDCVANGLLCRNCTMDLVFTEAVTSLVYFVLKWLFTSYY